MRHGSSSSVGIRTSGIVMAQGETITIQGTVTNERGAALPGCHHHPARAATSRRGHGQRWFIYTGTAARHRMDLAFRFCRLQIPRTHRSRLVTGTQRIDVRLTAGVALDASEVVADGERTKPVQRINPKSRRAFPLPAAPLKTCSFKPQSISRASCPAGTTCVEEVLTRTSSTSMTSKCIVPSSCARGNRKASPFPTRTWWNPSSFPPVDSKRSMGIK